MTPADPPGGERPDGADQPLESVTESSALPFRGRVRHILTVPVGGAAMTEPFVLDLDSNPHPRMLAEALEAQREAIRTNTVGARSFYAGFMAAMAAATGCTVGELLDWMARHKDRS